MTAKAKINELLLPLLGRVGGADVGEMACAAGLGAGRLRQILGRAQTRGAVVRLGAPFSEGVERWACGADHQAGAAVALAVLSEDGTPVTLARWGELCAAHPFAVAHPAIADGAWLDGASHARSALAVGAAWLWGASLHGRAPIRVEAPWDAQDRLRAHTLGEVEPHRLVWRV